MREGWHQEAALRCLLNNLHPKTNVGGLNSLHPTTVNPAVDPSFQSLYPGVNPNAGTPVNPNTFG